MTHQVPPTPEDIDAPNAPETPYRRRKRYTGKNPRHFEDKYKELNPQRYTETVAKVIASGKTPAGTHRPIMVGEILSVLAPSPGNVVVDCTLGHGGHTLEILPLIQPDGRLIGLDADPIELPKTVARIRAMGYASTAFDAFRTNYAGLPKILAENHITGVDCILADLGVSSMQLDEPGRGFSTKCNGPLDMRMNPLAGQTAAALIEKSRPDRLANIFSENADEPHADILAKTLAGHLFGSTCELASAIKDRLSGIDPNERELSVRRVFQALRIAVNDEFSALETLLRHLPACLNPGGCVAFLTFHSGEDRRVKKSFAAGLENGTYSDISTEVIRPSPAECGSNPRATSAKLRWARKSPTR